MTDSKKVLITGGSSYVGQQMVPYFVERGVDVCYTHFSTQLDESFPGRGVQADVRSQERMLEIVDEFRPDGIVHLAASNRSPNEESMTSSIEEGAKAVVEAAERAGCRLIHMSTDVIFDGTAAPYTESSPLAPPHAYGRAKANAEEIIKRYRQAVIIRPSLIYGLKIIDRSTEWMVSSIKEGKEITLFTDQLRNPVWVDTLSSACLELIDHTFTGILHVVGEQAMSRAEFGEKMLGWWGIKSMELVKMAPTPADLPWPADLRMDISLAKRTLKTPLLGVDRVIDMHNGS